MSVRLAARLVLLIAFLASGVWLARLDRATHISTDVLDLVPADERSPELSLVRSLASERHARVVLLALRRVAPAAGAASATTEPALPPAASVDAFVAALRASPAFREVAVVTDPAARDALGTFVFQRRFDLLLPAWLEAQEATYSARPTPQPAWPAWLASQTAEALDAFLQRPEALGWSELIDADPLLLLPSLTDALGELADGSGLGSSSATHTLIWAQSTDSPLHEAGQQPVFTAIAQALAAAQALDPAVRLEWTGVNRFAAESRRRIEAEFSSLNVLSLVAVLAIAALALPRMFKALHLVPVVAGATLGAWVVTLLVWDRVHVLVFVVGSLLAGVAIDYGFYLYLQPRLGPEDTYAAKVRRLIKPLLASALTTVLGFSLLLASDLPLIRQLGVFVSAGLLSALAAALLWFAQVREPWMTARPFVSRPLPLQSRGGRIAARVLVLGAALVAVLGPWHLEWRDDIRDLEIAAPELRANDAAVRTLFGETTDRTVYLTRGLTPAEARAALARFQAWHATAFPEAAAPSLGLLLPTPEAWAALPARVAALGAFPDLLASALAERGFEADSSARFSAAWAEWRGRPTAPGYEALVADVEAALRGPLAMLWSTRAGEAWFASLANHPPGAPPPAATATVEAAQLETLNDLFARYRSSALGLSALGLGLVGASVFVLYGWRQGAPIFALPAGSCLFAFGVLGLAGVTLNLFHLLGAFLGVCLSHNYAIFTAANLRRTGAPPPSIRLSALTTAAAFGVLALSAIPVVAALGSTVTLIVLTALAGVELAPALRRAPPAHDAASHPHEAESRSV